MTQTVVVAVDGPSGSGKSTVSKRLAAKLDARYLDTGAMYRAATWAVLQADAQLTDPDGIYKIVSAASLEIVTDPQAPSISVDGVNVDGPIRGQEVTKAVSAVAAVPAVRQLLVDLQRKIIAEAGRIVVEGRDIGTVVAPDADLKVYLTASEHARAARRSAEHAADHAATAADLRRRDHLDSTRKTDPLKQAADAVVLDSTELGIDEVVAELLRLLDK
ncbi:cytidylate kinase [Hamadaea flava]|uniref:Cytidylate kinase n=1 Tax=Hamadaea flava TaxID=1742688 RepID=A0ABV8LSY7_9ACTN|nr:(d)CMP kinase [Hamadaea flava]MCP2328658.1 cytidylate kinase [Hamadaea flava]